MSPLGALSCPLIPDREQPEGRSSGLRAQPGARPKAVLRKGWPSDLLTVQESLLQLPLPLIPRSNLPGLRAARLSKLAICKWMN